MEKDNIGADMIRTKSIFEKYQVFLWIIGTIILPGLLYYLGYDINEKKREPVFSVVNGLVLLYNKDAPSERMNIEITPLVSSNPIVELKGNIYLTEIVIWNAGELEI